MIDLGAELAAQGFIMRVYIQPEYLQAFLTFRKRVNDLYYATVMDGDVGVFDTDFSRDRSGSLRWGNLIRKLLTSNTIRREVRDTFWARQRDGRPLD